MGNHKDKMSVIERPRFIRCQRCNRHVEINGKGRIPIFCGPNCRHRAFVQSTKATMPTATERQRRMIWSVLKDAGLVTSDLPPPRRPEGAQ
jgi:DNA-directed RNA polymerase subunit RPC12/RpoP